MKWQKVLLSLQTALGPEQYEVKNVKKEQIRSLTAEERSIQSFACSVLARITREDCRIRWGETRYNNHRIHFLGNRNVITNRKSGNSRLAGGSPFEQNCLEVAFAATIMVITATSISSTVKVLRSDGGVTVEASEDSLYLVSVCARYISVSVVWE